MDAVVLDGRMLATDMALRQKKRAQEISRILGRAAGIGVVLVGDNPASHTYVRKKVEECYKVGIVCVERRLKFDATQSEVVEVINRFNGDTEIDGILVQLPLPPHIVEKEVIASIRFDKDVDGLNTYNAGLLSQRQMGISPCTPLGVVRLLEAYGIDVLGAEIVVVGDSNLVGRPMALMLLNRGATVTICQKHTVNLKTVTKRADILIVAVGKKNLINASFVKRGAIVIDIGFNNENGKCSGDVDFASVSKVASAITPVPGGVGPMTVVSLIENTLTLAERHATKMRFQN